MLQGGGDVLRAGVSRCWAGADLRARATGRRGRNMKTCKEGKHLSANGGPQEAPKWKVNLLRGVDREAGPQEGWGLV